MLRTSMVSLSILTVLCTLAHADPILYSGELTSAGDTLIGAGGWSESLVTFHWDVTQNEDLSWHYEYVFDRGSTQGNLSHLLLQTSANFTDADIWNTTPALQSEDPTWYTPDNGNPNMPGSIFGLSFSRFQSFPSRSSVLTLRQPMWGDFYAKDGPKAVSSGTQVLAAARAPISWSRIRKPARFRPRALSF